MSGKGKLVLIGGGVRSGKSRFALELAQKRGLSLAFIATAQAFDQEMTERIARHQEERGDTFVTIEAPTDVERALRSFARYDAVVLDCITLWLSNQLLRGDSSEDILETVRSLLAFEHTFDLIVVTNEVGMGVVPESALGRRFRDVAGSTHQQLSRRADEIYFATLGTILRLRPGPIADVLVESDV